MRVESGGGDAGGAVSKGLLGTISVATCGKRLVSVLN